MIIKTIFRAIFFTFLISFLGVNDIIAQFAGGSGSHIDPYQISTLQQLQEVNNHLDKHFVLVNDIDASETASWNRGRGFQPIGSEEKGFSGHFNAQGHTISALTIKRPSQKFIGLFGHIDFGEVHDLHLQHVEVEGDNITGGLAGRITNGTVTSSSVTGRVSGRTHVGGLVGFNRGRIESSSADVEVSGRSYVGGITGINRGRIIRVSAAVLVSGTGHNLGGLVGNNYDGLISQSNTAGAVNGESASSAGGLTGGNGGIIEESFTSADVSGRSYVGGLVGNNHSGTILWSYSTGSVRGFNLVGGLAGVNRRNGVIKECYTTSQVSGTVDHGGFIGVNRDPVKAGFWNQEASGQTEAVSKGASSGINALSSRELSGPESFEHMKGLSFNTIWGYVPDKTPQLLWTMPYFLITTIEAESSIISGDLIEFEVTVKNAGHRADTNQVVLNDGQGNIIDQLDYLILKSQQDTVVTFNWQTTVADRGTFALSFETQYFKKQFELDVKPLPDLVELNRPYELQEHVNISPTFIWEETFLAETYDLQIASNEEFSPVTITVSDIDTTFHKLTQTLDHLTYYHWRVRGVNPDLKGPWSEPSPFITIIERPEVVQLKEPKDEVPDASTRPTFSWTANERAEEYLLQISPDDEFEEVMFDTTISAIDSSLTMETELPSKQKLFWRMQASNIGGTSDWSKTRSFIPLIPPEKKSEFDGLDYTLEQNYPNPFNPVTYIRYSIPEGTRVQIKVLNMLGQTVATLVDDYKPAGWHTVTFDASKLSSGFYIYRIKAGEYSASKKLSLVK